jgi:hypothetical protein
MVAFRRCFSIHAEDTMIPSLVEACDRLYHVEIDAAMRRLAWDEELSHKHVAALIDTMCQAHKIEAEVIKHLSNKRRISIQPVSDPVHGKSADRQHTTSLNGISHNGSGPVILNQYRYGL